VFLFAIVHFVIFFWTAWSGWLSSLYILHINHFGCSFNVQGDYLIAFLVILSFGFMIYTHED
jgi:hypothetical protein